MKRIETGVLLAGLLALGLTACSSTRDNGMASPAMGGSEPMAGADSPPSSSGAAGSAAATAPNSTVTSIEVVPRQSGGAATGAATAGSAAVGGAGTAGTTGSSMTTDRAYRITLRMDDGGTQVVTQDWTPPFTTGDRVRIVSGAIQR